MKYINAIKDFLWDVYYYITGLPENIYERIKWFIQRGKKGYSDRDVWSFDMYLAEVICGGIGRLIKNNLRNKEDIKIFHEIKEGFDAYLEYREYKFNEIDIKRINKLYNVKTRKLKKSLKLLAEHFEILWD